MPLQKDFSTLLLVLSVPQAIQNGERFFEQQACHGLFMWSQFFSKIIIATPLIPKEASDPSLIWQSVRSIPTIDRIEFVSLPEAYHPKLFLFSFRKTSLLLSELIKRSDYLQFALGGLFGDWGSIAAREALKLGRNYAVHMDWVFHTVLLQKLKQSPKTYKSFIKRLEIACSKMWNHRYLKKAKLILCNGKTVYDYYKKLNRSAFLIHNALTSESDWIEPKALDQKIERIHHSKVLNLGYVGQMISMKAPIDWLKALAVARDLGAHFKATWYGEGDLREEFLRYRKEFNLDDIVEAPGWVSKRDLLLKKIEELDLFLMTHITEESPRCLIEALVKGTPIVGYESAYAKELCKGEALRCCPTGNWKRLGTLLFHLTQDRKTLSTLVEKAAFRGKDFSDHTLFEKRALLLKTTL